MSSRLPGSALSGCTRTWPNASAACEAALLSGLSDDASAATPGVKSVTSDDGCVVDSSPPFAVLDVVEAPLVSGEALELDNGAAVEEGTTLAELAPVLEEEVDSTGASEGKMSRKGSATPCSRRPAGGRGGLGAGGGFGGLRGGLGGVGGGAGVRPAAMRSAASSAAAVARYAL